VEEEQTEFFPKVRDQLGRKALNDLGEALAKAKTTAPTHPHPSAPDTPPGNTLVGTVAGVIDRVGDNISGIAQGGVTAVQDLIARVTNNSRPKVSPTGTTAARSRAAGVRGAATSAVDGVADTARNAGAGVAATAKAAKAATKATATSARRGARATATTARRGTTTTARTARAAAKKTAGTAKGAAAKTAKAAR
jgi:hypothetical protein